MHASPEHSNLLALPISDIPSGDLQMLKNRAQRCEACPLWEGATQTVFGKGKASASLMLVGEQPGDLEDHQGLPFAGPTAQLLQQALDEAQIEPADIYVTHVVKHFKFQRREGSRARTQLRANAAEQAACRRWLAAELLQVRPRAVVALGPMAAVTLFGRVIRITHDRGRWLHTEHLQGLVSWHPATILRTRDTQAREQLYRQLVDDLLQARIHALPLTRQT